MNDQRHALSCRSQQLLLYCYAELGAEDLRQVEQHLQSCSVCRAELSELQKLLDTVPAITPELSPVELDRFSARVMEHVQPQHRWFARPAWGLALAGGVALLITLNLNILLPESAPVQPKSPLMTADQDVLLNLDLLQDLRLLEDLELIQELEQLG